MIFLSLPVSRKTWKWVFFCFCFEGDLEISFLAGQRRRRFHYCWRHVEDQAWARFETEPKLLRWTLESFETAVCQFPVKSTVHVRSFLRSGDFLNEMLRHPTGTQNLTFSSRARNGQTTKNAEQGTAMFRSSSFRKKNPFLYRLRPKKFLNGIFNFPANFCSSTGTICKSVNLPFNSLYTHLVNLQRLGNRQLVF